MFFCAEKDTLICVDTKTGKILWQRATPPEGKPTKTHGTNGYTSATPVTNGKIVAVVFGSGIAAVYDIDGTKLWSRLIQRVVNRRGWGHCASPVLVGDTLIVSITDVFGLDAATGKPKWTAESKAHWGTPAVTKIGDVDVVITANGEVIGAADGKVLANGLISLPWTSPLVHKGVLYAIDEKGGKAIRLPEKISDEMEFKVLWTNQPPADRHYASPVVANGLLFAITRKGVFSVTDITNGEICAKRRLDFPEDRRKHVYSSIVLAGNKLLVSHELGTTFVLAPTVEYTELARNVLEPFRSTPVCVGNRMYIRGMKNLYCIGK
jgi:outer membrane protein assembly factor BamB